MIRSFTSELTTAANARPITNATASSTMLPRSRKSRNSFSMEASSASKTKEAMLSGARPARDRARPREARLRALVDDECDGPVGDQGLARACAQEVGEEAVHEPLTAGDDRGA